MEFPRRNKETPVPHLNFDNKFALTFIHLVSPNTTTSTIMRSLVFLASLLLASLVLTQASPLPEEEVEDIAVPEQDDDGSGEESSEESNEDDSEESDEDADSDEDDESGEDEDDESDEDEDEDTEGYEDESDEDDSLENEN